MPRHRIFATSFSSIYPLYVAKVERKDHSQAEVDQGHRWLTGYDDAGLRRVIDDEVTSKISLTRPRDEPECSLITGVICGIGWRRSRTRSMQQIRYMDKLVDEVARGKKMTSILRGSTTDA